MFHPSGTFGALSAPGEDAPWRIRALRGLVRALPRGRYRALSALAPAQGRFTARLAADAGGAKFACDMADQISREVCLTGLYEPPVTRVVQHHLRDRRDRGRSRRQLGLLLAARRRVGRPVRQSRRARTRSAAVRGARGERGDERVSAGDGDAGRGGGAARGASAWWVRRARREQGRVADRRSVRAGPPLRRAIDLGRHADGGVAARGPGQDRRRRGGGRSSSTACAPGCWRSAIAAILLELHPGLLREKGVDPASIVGAADGSRLPRLDDRRGTRGLPPRDRSGHRGGRAAAAAGSLARHGVAASALALLD